MICTARCAAMICQACGLDKKIPRTLFSVFFGGEGGDRTRAPVARPNSLANCPLHPLGTSPFRSVFTSRFYIIPHYAPIVKRIFLFLLKFIIFLDCRGIFTDNFFALSGSLPPIRQKVTKCIMKIGYKFYVVDLLPKKYTKNR